MSALRKIIEQAPAGTLFTREGLLKAMSEVDDGRIVRWVGTSRAMEILGETCERRVRRLHARWRQSQSDGGRPPVRVSVKSPRPGSDLLFDEDDLYDHARQGRVRVLPDRVEDESDELDEAATLNLRAAGFDV